MLSEVTLEIDIEDVGSPLWFLGSWGKGHLFFPENKPSWNEPFCSDYI